jgi:acyl-CoA reductase-like NAD-dependent aldehyde dehydrogenase
MTISASGVTVPVRHTDRFFIGGQLRTGAVGHNGFKSDFETGHGGFKQSGIGREGGIDGLLPFLEPKAILLDGPTDRYQGTER